MKNQNENSPPGWAGTVKAMLLHHKKEIDNPFALTWFMFKKKEEPHYKDDKKGTKNKKEPEKKEKFKKEKKKIKFKEWIELREGKNTKCPECGESKKHCKCKKHKLKYVFNVEGEPTEIEEGFNPETARVAHSAITQLGYGLGRPKIQGDNLVYSTPDPEDAIMIADDIPAQLAKWGVEGRAVAQGDNIIVTLNT